MPYAYEFVKSVESVAAFEGAKQLPELASGGRGGRSQMTEPRNTGQLNLQACFLVLAKKPQTKNYP
jgi:hypothetical protein